MTVQALLRRNRDEILRIARAHGVERIWVFGSTVRGDDSDGSDIHFLVEVGERTSPWFPAGLVEDLRELLGRPVDVVTKDSLHWVLKRRILSETKPL